MVYFESQSNHIIQVENYYTFFFTLVLIVTMITSKLNHAENVTSGA